MNKATSDLSEFRDKPAESQAKPPPRRFADNLPTLQISGTGIDDHLYTDDDPFPQDRQEPIIFKSGRSRKSINRVLVALRFIRRHRVFWDSQQSRWLYLESDNSPISNTRVPEGVIRQLLHGFLMEIVPAELYALIPTTLGAVYQEAKFVPLRLPWQQSPSCLAWVLANVFPIPKDYDGTDDGLATEVAVDLYVATQILHGHSEGSYWRSRRTLEMAMVASVAQKFPKARMSASRNQVRTMHPLNDCIVTGRGFPGLLIRPALVTRLQQAGSGISKSAPSADLFAKDGDAQFSDCEDVEIEVIQPAHHDD